jgi:hypothetical protein
MPFVFVIIIFMRVACYINYSCIYVKQVLFFAYP